MPLAYDIRPKTLTEYIGQEHIVGPNGAIPKMLKSKKLSNIILYGPPGTGKTTLAAILATEFNLPFYKVNASDAGIGDLRTIISTADKNGEDKFILFVDEIHLFKKNIQQFLLDYVESGRIVLIGSTAENPFFTIHKAILSRCNVFQLKELSMDNLITGLNRAFDYLVKEYADFEVIKDDKVIEGIAAMSNGDMRSALNKIELIFNACIDVDNKKIEFIMENVSDDLLRRVLRYDRDGDDHYDTLSAFMKSLRGSDPDAAIHYLAKLIKAEDLQGICRRLLCSASEDIGLANPQAVQVVHACVENALQLGLPEARIPLAQATIFLAISPKSNSCINAIDFALADLDSIDTGVIPNHLRDAHYAGAKTFGHGTTYKYPHNYENDYVEQQYLPDAIKNKKYYIPKDNKTEKSYADYWDKIKK
jgi:putative ATPase